MTKSESRHQEEVAVEHDAINHPKHYTQGIEVIDFIESHNLNFLLGSAIKYIVRSGLKDGEMTHDALRKAIWYLEHEIERLKKQAKEDVRDDKVDV